VGAALKGLSYDVLGVVQVVRGMIAETTRGRLPLL